MISLDVLGVPAPKGSGRKIVEADQLVAAYQRHGSVWKAAQELGISGQSVWERLRALGHKLNASKWTADEIAAAREMAGTVTVGEIANRLGRSYAGVACKLSELGIVSSKPRERKIPRGVGLTKRAMGALMSEAEADLRPVTQFCRSKRMHVDTFVLAAQTYEPDRWRAYVAARSPLAAKTCPYCSGEFIPSNGKQRTCSRKCQYEMRVDNSYFGGKRRSTVGLAERVCQLCARKDMKGLSSHHMLGKQNDPGNDYLIALCRGCHHIVTLLGRTNFVVTEAGWENLISLVAMRRLVELDGNRAGVHVAVDLEWLTKEQVEEDSEDEEPADDEDDAVPGRSGASITVEAL